MSEGKVGSRYYYCQLNIAVADNWMSHFSFTLVVHDTLALMNVLYELSSMAIVWKFENACASVPEFFWLTFLA